MLFISFFFFFLVLFLFFRIFVFALDQVLPDVIDASTLALVILNQTAITGLCACAMVLSVDKNQISTFLVHLFIIGNALSFSFVRCIIGSLVDQGPVVAVCITDRAKTQIYILPIRGIGLDGSDNGCLYGVGTARDWLSISGPLPPGFLGNTCALFPFASSPPKRSLHSFLFLPVYINFFIFFIFFFIFYSIIIASTQEHTL